MSRLDHTCSNLRDASQDGLAVDDGPIFPMFSRKADQDDWLRQQEERRRLAAEYDARESRSSLQSALNKAAAADISIRLCNLPDGGYMASAHYHRHNRRGALRALHRVIANGSAGHRVHIFASHELLPGPRGPMADDCRGFVAMKWRLVP